jgi:hypothetical protein
MKTIYFLTFLSCLIFTLSAQDLTPPEKEPEPFIQFDFRLAPTSQGALEGFACINLLWFDYLKSGVSFTVTNFTSVYDEYGGNTTTIDSNKVLNIEVLKTRDELLKLSWSENSYLCFNASLSTAISWFNQEKYGHGELPGPLVFAYFSNQDIFSVKPLAYAELVIALDSITLQGYGSVSPLSIIEHTKGEFFFSYLGSKLKYSIDDQSIEIQSGGKLSYKPAPELEFKLGFNYTWHSAKAAGVVTGMAAVEKFPYQSDEYEFLVSGSFSIFGLKPTFGVSYVYFKYRPQDTLAAVSYSSDRFRFQVGMITY